MKNTNTCFLSVKFANRSFLKDQLFQSVRRWDEADVAIFFDFSSNPPVRVELLEDVKIVPDLEADGTTVYRTFIVQGAIVHDISADCESNLSVRVEMSCLSNFNKILTLTLPGVSSGQSL